MIELHKVVLARRLAMLLLVVALAGCGVWPLDRPTDSPSPLPGDRLVFMVEDGAGGFTPQFHRALLTPALAVYGDGRVIQYDGKQAGDVPAAYVISRVDPESVAGFVADAEARNLINDQTDFGDPRVTDMPSTTVQLHGTSRPHRIYVYAFGEGFDDDLTGAQRQARQELAEVIDRAYALAGDAERLPYRPDRVKVTEFALNDAGKGRGMVWPGPDPESFLKPSTPRWAGLACGELSDPAAEKVYRAARKNPDGIWISDSKQRLFAVVPILPTRGGCPE
jgi:hypothetical protein